MEINSINYRVKTKKKKLGRGIGSGKGKTSGRGHKGQKSRSGVAIKSFEGGQMPLYRRLPKRGFNSLRKDDTLIMNLEQLQIFLDNNTVDKEAIINLAEFKKKKLIKDKYKKIKILGNGEIKNKINIELNSVSKSAKEKIEKVGGSIVIIKKNSKK